MKNTGLIPTHNHWLYLAIFIVIAGCGGRAVNPRERSLTCPDGYALTLVVDKSKSVEDYNLVDNQKRAIAEVIPRLRSETELSIVIFDTLPFVLIKAVNMTPEGKARTLARLRVIFPNGKTYPSPAIQEAVRLVSSSQKGCRAMVFMSDGKFEDPLLPHTLRHVSAATRIEHVASLMLLNEGDTQAMKKIAENWKGDFIALDDPEQLTEALTEVFDRWGLL